MNVEEEVSHLYNNVMFPFLSGVQLFANLV